jgi:UPF0755 protein
MRSRNPSPPRIFLLIIAMLLCLLAGGVIIPLAAQKTFGEPKPSLDWWQRLSYGYTLIWNVTDLTQPCNPAGREQLFVIPSGESVISISERLEQAGLIHRASTFRVYLIWTGLDTIIQSGTYRLSPAQTGLDIAQRLKSTTLAEIYFTILAGWRLEEIAASLPTSGLDFSAEAFLAAANSPEISPGLIPVGASVEGFLYPGTYLLPRTTTVDQFISTLLERFSSHLPADSLSAYANHGLTLYQAVTLASIIQREVVGEDEMPLIASVLFNRLAIGMKLQTDPTLQYAIGFNSAQGTWWTNPLSSEDLQINSPYNTYLFPGLPPGPISNPGQAALAAVANPAQTTYYYFQARCDGSGLHNFSETYEQHEQNNCYR